METFKKKKHIKKIKINLAIKKNILKKINSDKQKPKQQ